MSKARRRGGRRPRTPGRILVLNGPKFNMLGTRQPEIYGRGAWPAHLSNIYSREPFRRYSYFSDLAVGTICGLGSRGYDLAPQYAIQSG